MYIKKLAKNFPGLLIPQVNEEVYLSYLCFTHYPVHVAVTQIQQLLCKVTLSADFSIYINGFGLQRS